MVGENSKNAIDTLVESFKYFLGIKPKISTPPVPQDRISELIDSLYSDIRWIYSPTSYRENLGEAIIIAKNKDRKFRYGIESKIPCLVEAIKYGLKRVGFRVHLSDSGEYLGKLGVSPTLWKLYEMDENKKIGIDILMFDPVRDAQLGPISLKMHKEDAAIVFGTSAVESAKDGVIDSVKIEDLYIEPRQEQLSSSYQLDQELEQYMKEESQELPPSPPPVETSSTEEQLIQPPSPENQIIPPLPEELYKLPPPPHSSLIPFDQLSPSQPPLSTRPKRHKHKKRKKN
jgi:hypothetical protein